MLIKHGDGKILTVVKNTEDIEQAKKLAEEAQKLVKAESVEKEPMKEAN